MEACGSAHHWGRLALRLGHRVLLMSPHLVAPHTRGNKNDVNDADGITEASSRPGMRFVGVKSVGQQHLRQLHRARQLAVKDRTAHGNQIHGFLLEYGIESSRGVGALLRRLADVLEDAENELPSEGRALLCDLGEELRRLDDRVKTFDDRIKVVARAEPACRRLESIPGIGPLTATALVAAVGEASEFRNGRELAAWLGLVPRQHSTGGKPRLGRISKMGQRDVRRLLITGAMSVIRQALRRGAPPGSWLARMLARKPRMLVAVALANKMARIAWAVMKNKEVYREPAPLA